MFLITSFKIGNKGGCGGLFCLIDFGRSLHYSLLGCDHMLSVLQEMSFSFNTVISYCIVNLYTAKGTVIHLEF